jgi:hypothetical protein
MTKQIKQIAEQTMNKVNQLNISDKPEQWIDAFVLELSRSIVQKCSEVVRQDAKDALDDNARTALKLSAINILEKFGL